MVIYIVQALFLICLTLHCEQSFSFSVLWFIIVSVHLDRFVNMLLLRVFYFVFIVVSIRVFFLKVCLVAFNEFLSYTQIMFCILQ